MYVPKTYVYMINSNEALVKEFLDRGMLEDARYYTNVLLYGTYYMLNKPISFCVQFWEIAKEYNVSYPEMRELLLNDERFSRAHTFV